MPRCWKRSGIANTPEPFWTRLVSARTDVRGAHCEPLGLLKRRIGDTEGSAKDERFEATEFRSVRVDEAVQIPETIGKDASTTAQWGRGSQPRTCPRYQQDCHARAVHTWLISRSYDARKCLSRAACTEKLILHRQCRRESPKQRRHPVGRFKIRSFGIASRPDAGADQVTVSSR
jgi:hypothetical protein